MLVALAELAAASAVLFDVDGEVVLVSAVAELHADYFEWVGYARVVVNLRVPAEIETGVDAEAEVNFEYLDGKSLFFGFYYVQVSIPWLQHLSFVNYCL